MSLHPIADPERDAWLDAEAAEQMIAWALDPLFDDRYDLPLQHLGVTPRTQHLSSHPEASPHAGLANGGQDARHATKTPPQPLAPARGHDETTGGHRDAHRTA